jgi:hypothetical protein
MNMKMNRSSLTVTIQQRECEHELQNRKYIFKKHEDIPFLTAIEMVGCTYK